MLTDIISEIAYIYNESAIYILFGFLIAGIIKIFFSPEKVLKHLGRKDIRSVLLASLFGIPLPLCSCAVLPTAMSLRKQGASKGATLAFLISTPETGVDSISLTYALIDPVMTVFRPLSALITAVTAGMFATYVEKREPEGSGNKEKPAAEGCDGTCEHEHDASSQKGQRGKLLSGLFHYAFVDLLNDIVFWLIIGIVAAGILSALVPGNFFESFTGSGVLSMFIMLAVGIPIYMCAASSTPIAAVLIMKGLNPGAALVFLLSGPATNIGTIAAVGKFLGKKMMVIYLGTIAVVSICLGIFLNAVYSELKIDPAAVAGKASELIPAPLKLAGSLILLIIIINNLWDIGFENSLQALNEKLFEFTGFKITINRKYLDPILKSKDVLIKFLPLILAALYLLSGFTVIKPGESGIVKRFGKVVRYDVKPGLHYIIPYPVDKLIRVNASFVKRLSFDIINKNSDKTDKQGDTLMLTGDENIIDARFTINYRVKDVYNHLFSAAENEQMIKAYVRSAIIKTVGGEKIDSVYYSGRQVLQEKIMKTLQSRLDAYSSGIEVLNVQLIYSHAPSDVHFFFRDVASAAEDKNTKINEAQKYRNSTILSAKGEAAKILLDAQSYKTEKINSASGEAEAFLKQAYEFKNASDITKTRMYLETMEKVLPGLNKIIKPVSSRNQMFDFWFLNQKIDEEKMKLQKE